MAAVTGLNLRTLGQRRGASLAAVVRHRRGGGRLRRRPVDRRGLPPDAWLDRRLAGHGDRAARRQRLRDDERPPRDDDADHRRGARASPRDAQGPVASAELFVVVDMPKRSTGTDANVPLRGVQPAAFERPQGAEDRPGPPLRAGAQRGDRGPGGAPGSSPASTSAPRCAGARTEWTVVGDLHRRRRRRRVGDLVRRRGAAAGLPARHHLPVGLRQARSRRRPSTTSRTT